MEALPCKVCYAPARTRMTPSFHPILHTQGIDPNFQDPDGNETPMTAAAAANNVVRLSIACPLCLQIFPS